MNQINSILLRLIVIGAIFSALACTSAKDKIQYEKIDKRRPVAYVKAGHTVYSNLLENEVRSAIDRSHDFKYAKRLDPGTLVIFSVSSVGIEQVGKRYKAFYTIVFKFVDSADWDLLNHPALSEIEGSCWVEDMRKCAAQIVDAARNADRKIK
jgi:hypothetical protein